MKLLMDGDGPLKVFFYETYGVFSFYNIEKIYWLVHGFINSLGGESEIVNGYNFKFEFEVKIFVMFLTFGCDFEFYLYLKGVDLWGHI